MAVNAFTRNTLLSALTLIALQGCNENNDNGQIAAATQTVNLTITKGPISGASCTLFEASGKKLAGPVLSSGGAVGFKDISASGTLYAECAGGSYVDEATGVTKTLGATEKMRGVLPTGGSQLIVSPLTEIAFRRSKAVGSSGAVSDIGAKL